MSCLTWVFYKTLALRFQSKAFFYLSIYDFRDTTGKNYHSELAREIEKFMNNVINEFGGVLALVDVYCLYNRARGTDLISPDDLLIACEKLN